MSINDQRQVIVINDTGVTNGETATGNVDTLGWDFVTIDLLTSTSNTASNNLSVLKLSECDTTDGAFVDVDGTVGDDDFTIPNAVTQGNWGVKFNVDCRARKRYLKVTVTPVKALVEV
jgi:hypothetical protein